MSRAFPEGFRWATATAAHQVEGGNVNNDWWEWEQTPGSGCVEPSGDACDQYHRYPRPTSPCWPPSGSTATGSRSSGAASSPRRASSPPPRSTTTAGCARPASSPGLDAGVTFHHFTTPRWATADGGWAEPAIVDRFARFCEAASGHLGDLLARGRAPSTSPTSWLRGLPDRRLPARAPSTATAGRRPAANFRAGHRRASTCSRRARATSRWASPSRWTTTRPCRPTTRRPWPTSTIRGHSRGRVPRGLPGRRLHRRPDLQPPRVGPDAHPAGRGRRRGAADGLRVLARMRWPRPSAGPGR